MKRPLRILAGVACFLFFVGAAERAAHFEDARAGANQGHNSVSVMSAAPGQGGPPVQLEQPGYRWQGRTASWWAKRAVQARRDANARGRTIRRLKAELRRGFIPWYWLAVGSCESGLRWSYNGSSGYDGALQYLPGTWTANRLSGYPAVAWQASPFQQLVVAEIVLAASGWGQWPDCAKRLGLR